MIWLKKILIVDKCKLTKGYLNNKIKYDYLEMKEKYKLNRFINNYDYINISLSA